MIRPPTTPKQHDAVDQAWKWVSADGPYPGSSIVLAAAQVHLEEGAFWLARDNAKKAGNCMWLANKLLETLKRGFE